VIGAAGLIATSIWQYRQSETSRHQAESQQKIAETQAENSWRIQRAEILSKNVHVLSSGGDATAEQRYGVLLSLTRGNLLDPDLAVSYALELGKNNADYMRSVLATVSDKSYGRLAGAFELTCEQRFGFARDVPACAADSYRERAHAIGQVFADEIDRVADKKKAGPMKLLNDEHDVQAAPSRFAWLFAPYLISLYDRRQWDEIAQFEAYSPGARLTAAIVLGPTQYRTLVATSEVGAVDKFHDARAFWLVDYLHGPTCNAECKARLMDIMITNFTEVAGRFDQGFAKLLARPRSEAGIALGRLHARLISCQVEGDDVVGLRDQALIPALEHALAEPAPDKAKVEELLSLIVLAPDPEAPAAGAAPAPQRARWQATINRTQALMQDQFKQVFDVRRAAAEASRKTPPSHLQAGMFCGAALLPRDATDLGER
ncbi:MAG TPA: hypothetical protein VK509_01270, partial [Polyangiales bacterium]|nr:hypothetical protein [Polyangiales bacterium]